MSWFVFSGGCPSDQKMTLSRRGFHENCLLKAPGLAQCLLKAEFCLMLSSEVWLSTAVLLVHLLVCAVIFPPFPEPL